MKLFQLMMSKVSILISVKDIEYNGQLFPLFLDACCDIFSNLSRLKKESKRSRLFTFLICKHVLKEWRRNRQWAQCYSGGQTILFENL